MCVRALAWHTPGPRLDSQEKVHMLRKGVEGVRL